MKKFLWGIMAAALVCFALPATSQAQDAAKVVQDSFNYMRGKASVSVTEMVIHRPDWERKMVIKAWTKGETDSLFTITAPPKDMGNGTLKRGREMWTYNPKVNRVIKLPPSMMSQAWMGSDFSNNDLSKSDSIIKDYVHTIEGTKTLDGKKVFLIKSMPKENAPVVWGMQKLRVREDGLMLGQEYYDEDLKLVKAIEFLDIKPIGGKPYPTRWKVAKTGEKEKYTLLQYKSLEFKDTLPDRWFTLGALRSSHR